MKTGNVSTFSSSERYYASDDSNFSNRGMAGKEKEKGNHEDKELTGSSGRSRAPVLQRNKLSKPRVSFTIKRMRKLAPTLLDEIMTWRKLVTPQELRDKDSIAAKLHRKVLRMRKGKLGPKRAYFNYLMSRLVNDRVELSETEVTT